MGKVDPTGAACQADTTKRNAVGREVSAGARACAGSASILRHGYGFTVIPAKTGISAESRALYASLSRQTCRGGNGRLTDLRGQAGFRCTALATHPSRAGAASTLKRTAPTTSAMSRRVNHSEGVV